MNCWRSAGAWRRAGPRWAGPSRWGASPAFPAVPAVARKASAWPRGREEAASDRAGTRQDRPGARSGRRDPPSLAISSSTSTARCMAVSMIRARRWPMPVASEPTSSRRCGASVFPSCAGRGAVSSPPITGRTVWDGGRLCGTRPGEWRNRTPSALTNYVDLCRADWRRAIHLHQRRQRDERGDERLGGVLQSGRGRTVGQDAQG